MNNIYICISIIYIYKYRHYIYIYIYKIRFGIKLPISVDMPLNTNQSITSLYKTARNIVLYSLLGIIAKNLFFKFLFGLDFFVSKNFKTVVGRWSFQFAFH